jgi:hypothetical protein
MIFLRKGLNMFFTKELVSSHYLNLLNDLSSGIPIRVLQVANSINNMQDLEFLVSKLNNPIVKKIKSKSLTKFGDLWCSDRVQALRNADACKIDLKFRLAVKNYGLILLMSESIDDPLKWAVHQLRDLSESNYGFELKNDNLCLIQI